MMPTVSSATLCVGGLMGYFLSFRWMQSALLLRRRIALYLHIFNISISLHCAKKSKEYLYVKRLKIVFVSSLLEISLPINNWRG